MMVEKYDKCITYERRLTNKTETKEKIRVRTTIKTEYVTLLDYLRDILTDKLCQSIYSVRSSFKKWLINMNISNFWWF